jgi:hypothetical protein
MWQGKYYFTKNKTYEPAKIIDGLMANQYHFWFDHIMGDLIQPTRKALKIYKRRDIHISEIIQMKEQS